jgi:hypothetical protein
MDAMCASLNFDLFMILPRPTARITHAAKLEFSSRDRSKNREAGQRFSAISQLDTSSMESFLPILAIVHRNKYRLVDINFVSGIEPWVVLWSVHHGKEIDPYVRMRIT